MLEEYLKSLDKEQLVDYIRILTNGIRANEEELKGNHYGKHLLDTTKSIKKKLGMVNGRNVLYDGPIFDLSDENY